MKKIIVTGGCGYIGSHTVLELIYSGFQPIIIDNLSNTSIQNLNGLEELVSKKIEFYQLDCTNNTEMDYLFNKLQDVFALIHFAGYKSVEESVQKPQKYYDNNIKSIEVILSCCNKYGIENFIFSSSCTVYGEPLVLPVSEKADLLKPSSPYGHTKQLCEEILSKNKINSISLRYFNPIGAHKSGLIGDCSLDKPSNLVPIITKVAAKKNKELLVFGNDYNTKDGSCVRDYIHVQDLSISHVKAIQYLFKNPGKFVFNVGSGKGVSVLEIITKFQEANSVIVPYQVVSRREGDVEKIYASTEKIEKELNWKTQITLEQALKDAWNWELNKSL